jgi:hypothetical protein
MNLLYTQVHLVMSFGDELEIFGEAVHASSRQYFNLFADSDITSLRAMQDRSGKFRIVSF